MTFTIWHIIFLAFLFTGFCAGQAAYQAAQFAHNKVRNHWEMGLYYALFCTCVAIGYWGGFNLWAGVEVGLFGIVTRAAFFDPIINIIRGKALWYNSIPSNRFSGSLLDWIENKFFAQGKINWIVYLKIGYLVLWVAYIIFILR